MLLNSTFVAIGCAGAQLDSSVPGSFLQPGPSVYGSKPQNGLPSNDLSPENLRKHWTSMHPGYVATCFISVFPIVKRQRKVHLSHRGHPQDRTPTVDPKYSEATNVRKTS